MSAILFALISYLGWGIGDFLSAFSTRKIGPYSFAFWSNAIWFLIFIPFYPFFINDLSSFSWQTFLILSAVSILDIVGLLAFYEGLRIGPVSLVGTISSSFAALVVVFSIVFLKEAITIWQLMSILVIFLGLFFSTLDLKVLKTGRPVLTKGVALGLLAMFCWGIAYTFIKIPIKEIGWFWSNNFLAFYFPFIYLFMRIRKIKLIRPDYNKALPFVIGSSLLFAAGGTSFNYAISRGLSSIVAPIAGSYPTLLVLLAFIFFKDKITKQQVLGIITTILGIVLLAFCSV
jgi:drug/metabolite transporter (DMT)-like permease